MTATALRPQPLQPRGAHHFSHDLLLQRHALQHLLQRAQQHLDRREGQEAAQQGMTRQVGGGLGGRHRQHRPSSGGAGVLVGICNGPRFSAAAGYAPAQPGLWVKARQWTPADRPPPAPPGWSSCTDEEEERAGGAEMLRVAASAQSARHGGMRAECARELHMCSQLCRSCLPPLQPLDWSSPPTHLATPGGLAPGAAAPAAAE